MGKVSSLTITDSGNYYTFGPTVVIDFPVPTDSDFVGKIDSANPYFGFSSLVHDSADTTVVATLADTYGGVNQQPVELAFWIKPTSLYACTIAWSDDFRIVMDSNGLPGMAFTVDSTIYADSHAVGVTQTRYANHALDSNQWNFVHFELLNNVFRPNVDSVKGSDFTLNITGNYPYDSGDIIRFGADLNDSSPIATSTGVGKIPSKGFTGYIDHFTFTKKTSQPIFDNVQSNRFADSAGDYYFGQTPDIIETFDYKRATASAYIDSATGEVNRLVIVDSGYGYSSVPNVTLLGGRSAAFDSQYDIGDDITQTLSSGVKIKGEVQRYQLDSDSDGSRYLFLAHVGADDGEFREFVNDISLNKTYPAGSVGLKVTGVNEINNISETEQNDLFTATDVDDFLDFSEDNPFGDPENQ